MSDNSTNTFNTPIAFLVFNRPESTRRVFEEIRRIRPTKLLVVADGPRSESERKICAEVRAIIDTIDWPCTVLRNYSDINLGCKVRVSSGLDWVFTEVDRAIVLEDDCLPHPTFFPYCAELLEKYADDESVMHISGDNFHAKNPAFRCEESYYFSNIPHIWGWASWRRAWKHYDVHIRSWPEVRARGYLRQTFGDEPTAARWEDKFDSYYAGRINSWDGQWAYACIVNRGFCIMPAVNLISNIGFGSSGTHTQEESAENEVANLPTYAMDFPLTHPQDIKLNRQAVEYLSDYIFGVYKYRTATSRVKRFLKKMLPQLYLRIKGTQR